MAFSFCLLVKHVLNVDELFAQPSSRLRTVRSMPRLGMLVFGSVILLLLISAQLKRVWVGLSESWPDLNGVGWIG